MMTALIDDDVERYYFFDINAFYKLNIIVIFTVEVIIIMYKTLCSIITSLADTATFFEML
jgi:hypothetical protein